MLIQGGVICMAPISKIKIRQKRRGQLFLVEVFIALSVLILLMIAIYQVEFSSDETYPDNLSEIGYNTLESLNKAGTLKPLVYNLQTTELADSLDNALPENIFWRLSVEDDAGASIFTLYWERTPPADASVGATDYFLFGYDTILNQYRVIHLELWRLVG
jgi:hypothetical protein